MPLQQEKKKCHSGELPKEFGRYATLLQSATPIGHSPYLMKIQKQLQKVTGAVFDLWPLLDGPCRGPVPSVSLLALFGVPWGISLENCSIELLCPSFSICFLWTYAHFLLT